MSKMEIVLHQTKENAKKFKKRIFRNSYDIMGKKISDHEQNVILEWWKGANNVGDCLAPIIFDWMLKRNGVLGCSSKKNIHLMTVGSLIGGGEFDSVIWGSGIMDAVNIMRMAQYSKYVKYDIRAVRGPITQQFLKAAGYDTNNMIYGDPGIIMPLIYKPNPMPKKYKYSVIYHLMDDDIPSDNRFHIIDVRTDNYKKFINEIVASEVIVSASLHGIILAESYGIPAVFLNRKVNSQILKYIDWYYSTGRNGFLMISNLDEAFEVTPIMPPDISKMQSDLINVFPYDIFL